MILGNYEKLARFKKIEGPLSQNFDVKIALWNPHEFANNIVPWADLRVFLYLHYGQDKFKQHTGKEHVSFFANWLLKRYER